jgi:hypothetical protein
VSGFRRTITILVSFACAPGAAAQQTNAPRLPASAIEAQGGYAGFVDNATIDHGVIGASARFYLTPRLGVGPELVYMRGPRNDRDIFVTGNLTFDFRGPRSGRPPRVVPYLVAGGGWFQHLDRFGAFEFSSAEGTFTAGGGARVWASDRVYAGAEYRFGWELHYRVTGHVGFALGR